jgi:hypothetical protein
MKKLTMIFLVFFSASLMAEEYACMHYALSRANGRAVQSFKGHSNYSQNDACHKAQDFCRRYTSTTANTFCYTANKSNYSYDGRYKPAIAYYQGITKRRFPAVCYGLPNGEAKAYCQRIMMQRCREYIKSGNYYGYICSFL